MIYVSVSINPTASTYYLVTSAHAEGNNDASSLRSYVELNGEQIDKLIEELRVAKERMTNEIARASRI